MTADAELLTAALRAQQAGRSAEAAELCRQVLAGEADHPQASLLLGLIVGRDDAAAGAALIERFLARFPDEPVATCNLGLLRQRLGEDAAALVLFGQALARQPDLAAAWQGSGAALHRLGRLDEAAAAFERALALGADPALTRNDLGELRRAQGRLDAALAELDAALGLAPQLAVAHLNRGSVLARLGRPADAVTALRQALALAPESIAAHLELADALEALRLPEDARRHRSEAYRRQPVTIEPRPDPSKTNDPVATVLLLCSADRRDVSVRFLIDPTRFAKLHLVLLRPQDGGPHPAAVLDALPRYDIMFNTIADADLGVPYFAQAAAIAARSDRPVLNPPARLGATRRDRLAETLAGIPDLLVPATRRLSRAALLAQPLDGPKLVRPAGAHGGETLDRVAGPAELQRFLLKTSADEFYLTDFVDFRSADGLYRKYRLIFVDREPYPYHLAIGPHWKLHYWRIEQEVTDAMKREEAAFLADWESVFPGRLAVAARAIARRLDLDYGGMDCGLTGDGRIVLFEANANMLVHLNDSAASFPYKHAHVPRIFEAMTALLQRRLTASRISC
jgi:tetratricopeptide (TPR) repeat protein